MTSNDIFPQGSFAWRGWQHSGSFSFPLDLPSHIVDGEAHLVYSRLLNASNREEVYEAALPHVLRDDALRATSFCNW